MTSSAKKLCPFMEKCYRKNPIHFSEMSHPHLEKLLVNKLDTTIQIPEVLQFPCTDRSQLLDQLKVLQMVLRKERDKNRDNSLPVTNNEFLKTKFELTDTLNNKKTLREKVDTHKKTTTQVRQDKVEQINMEMEVLYESLPNKKQESSKSITPKKRSQDTSSPDSFVTKKMRQVNIEDRNQQSISDIQSTSATSEQGTSVGTRKSIMDIYQNCDTAMSRREMRKQAIQMIRDLKYSISIVEPGEFAIKYALSAPYHLFFTRVEKSRETYKQEFSVTFPEILDISLGEIVNSLHINFMVDVGWLCLQYLLAGQRTDMMILYGDRVDEEKLGSHINMIHIETPTRFGCHHSKVMILQYKDDGIRIIVSTANLYSDDWENRTQGLWISPHLPPLQQSANSTDGESPTGFKKDFERYLSKYKQSALTRWIQAVRKADFSAVNVFFIASVPGTHKDIEIDFWGHRKLAYVLSRHAVLPSDSPQWPVVAQSSSIGSLGPNYESWLSKEIVPSMSREVMKNLKSHPNFHFVYPSLQNYMQSFDRQNLSSCLPYRKEVHLKQQWIESYLYQWKATQTARDRAIPHIKSYTRISPDLKRIPWFVLTSANLSKAAWGVQRSFSHYIMSYEAGVIFIPKFITGATTFPVEKEEENSAIPVFHIPYDLPLCRYRSTDHPFVSNVLEDLDKV